jgi:Ca2+-binding EF-hand superfamily protein
MTVEQEARAMFNELDEDGDGTLDVKELVTLCKSLGIQRGDANVVMKQLDADGDGSVTLDEFEAWWRRNGSETVRKRQQLFSAQRAGRAVNGMDAVMIERRTRLFDLRIKQGLVAQMGQRAAVKQHWLTTRQQILCGNLKLADEEKIEQLKDRETHMLGLEQDYADKVIELNRKIETAKLADINEVEDARNRLEDARAELIRLQSLLDITTGPDLRRNIEDDIRRMQMLIQQLELEDELLRDDLSDERRAALLKQLEELMQRQQDDMDVLERRVEQEALELDLAHRIALMGLVGAGHDLTEELAITNRWYAQLNEAYSWDDEAEWQAAQRRQMSLWTGIYDFAETDTDGWSAAKKSTEGSSLDMAARAAELAHQAVRHDASGEADEAARLYRKSTILLEKAARQSEWAPHFLAKGREYWSRADLLSGQDAIENMFRTLDVDGSGAIEYTELRDGLGYLEQQVLASAKQTLRPTYGHFWGPVPAWRAMDVARWLTEEVGLPELSAVFVEHEVDGELLMALEEADMVEMGVASGVNRKRIIVALCSRTGESGLWRLMPEQEAELDAWDTTDEEASDDEDDVDDDGTDGDEVGPSSVDVTWAAHQVRPIVDIAWPSEGRHWYLAGHPSTWLVADVACWLAQDVGVSQAITGAFVEHEVDGELLMALEEADMVEMGVASGVSRKRIVVELCSLIGEVNLVPARLLPVGPEEELDDDGAGRGDTEQDRASALQLRGAEEGGEPYTSRYDWA